MSIDGRLQAPGQAQVSVFDRGFLYGDGVFESMRTYGGVPFAEWQHLERLERSARSVRLTMPCGLETLQGEIREAITAASYPECYVRVMITRGVGPVRPDPASAEGARRVVMVIPFESPADDLYRHGLKAALTRRTPPGGAAKVTSYQPHILAGAEARDRGADVAVLLGDDGQVLEGASSNVMMIRRGVLYTPPLETGILPGVTRATVLGLARLERMRTSQPPLFPVNLYRADEVFLTSSLREVVPVVEIDGQPIADGRPGPVTRRLHEAYRRLTGPSRA